MVGERHQVPGENASESAALRVLIVVSDILVRLSISEHLREQHVEVAEAVNLREAIELVQAGMTPNVAFIDLELAGPIGGLELFRWLKDKEIPTLVTAGSFSPSFSQVLSPGQFVAKPFTPSDLVKRLKEYRPRA